MFEADLRFALDVASQANSSKYRAAQSSTFGHWLTFCQQLQVPPSLRTVRDHEARLGYLLVYAMRYRSQGRQNQPVRSATVDKALLAVAKGITDLGGADPRKDLISGKFHPLYSAFLKALADDDDPPSRAYPVNTTILRQLWDILDTRHPEDGPTNAHVIDLIIVAFFWLLRPAEYTYSSTPEARTQAFEFQHIHFTIRGRTYSAPTAPLNDATLRDIEYAALEFSDQKNAVRGEQVGHRPNSDPVLCPVKALGRIALRLRQANAPPTEPMHRHYNRTSQRWYNTKSTFITNALRHAARALEQQTGIAPSLLSARSLRPGGATALLCANAGTDSIMLLGRWKSDAMFRYLRVQAATSTFSQTMLDHGAFTFAPSAYANRALPREAPAPVAALLQHDQLYT